MKESLLRVNNLGAKLVSLQAKITILRNDYEIAYNNVSQLEKAERTLMYNIKFLKQYGTIPIVSQYRKSLEELSLIRRHLESSKGMRDIMEKELDKNVLELDRTIREYQEAERILKEEKVILIFNKDRKRKKA